MPDLLLHTLGGLVCGAPGIALMAFIAGRKPAPTSKETPDAR